MFVVFFFLGVYHISYQSYIYGVYSAVLQGIGYLGYIFLYSLVLV